MKKVNLKLSLQKLTISNLDTKDMQAKVAGITGPGCAPTSRNNVSACGVCVIKYTK